MSNVLRVRRRGRAVTKGDISTPVSSTCVAWGGGSQRSGETEGFLTTQGTVSRARVLRRSLTPPEARLWVCLRGRQLAGLKFRRQHPVGVFVLDFYCAEARLAVEVDGQQHGDAERSEHDRRRTVWLATQGISVLRIAAEDLRVNLDGILTWIRTNAEERVRG
ncbi:MAG: endonuclease domain-containing protein [Alphaproteobacteria bacterium]|nr:endonuclease domain-containing protein [Alphaproteobacteria bacterium]MBU2378408.1 endonuclease domain-containing protein [Alphaproteobacteria bacterium]